jgi:hypothetical protein
MRRHTRLATRPSATTGRYAVAALPARRWRAWLELLILLAWCAAVFALGAGGILAAWR